MANEDLVLIAYLLTILAKREGMYYDFNMDPPSGLYSFDSWEPLEFDSFEPVVKFNLMDSTNESHKFICNYLETSLGNYRKRQNISLKFFDNDLCVNHMYLYCLIKNVSVWEKVIDLIETNKIVIIISNNIYRQDPNTIMDFFLELTLRSTPNSGIDSNEIFSVHPLINFGYYKSQWFRVQIDASYTPNGTGGFHGPCYTNFSHYYLQEGYISSQIVKSDIRYTVINWPFLDSLASHMRSKKLYSDDNYTRYINNMPYLYEFPEYTINTQTMTTTIETFTFNHPTTNPVPSSNHYTSTESITIRTSGDESNSLVSNLTSSSIPNDDSIDKSREDSKMTVLISLLVVIPIVIAITSLIVILHYRKRAMSKSQEMEFLARIACQV
jgi:hypothetical protein